VGLESDNLSEYGPFSTCSETAVISGAPSENERMRSQTPCPKLSVVRMRSQTPCPKLHYAMPDTGGTCGWRTLRKVLRKFWANVCDSAGATGGPLTLS
jgi:hypothetical protein